ncbi:fatty acyl-CoA reductase 1-like [Aricia agestis]|uniref:fatty acyl-CoA reductase 1-like n=1 Tax=Aricia agestis TaxID=91739 RepID=UPI001C208C78|nr:fatty acyl-CoA reductase 1-like [Aricia agestis]
MGFLEERDLEGVCTIPEYFRGKTIFITGGSGFMGKVLLEKLLYSCSDLERVYLLLRDKKGVKAEERLKQLYASRCFDRLRRERAGLFEQKVFYIGGDVTQLGLGMSEEDRTLLVNRTHIIYHVAACVRFDDPLKEAVKLNLRGTREIVELAKDVMNLEALVHVSTSYANTNRAQIDEVVYPPFADWRQTLDICDRLDDDTLNVLTAKYLGELPNTYVFTKQLAEHVVYEQRGQLPVVIVRPSIVISSIEEPAPGWVENLNGPVGMLVASGKGILRSMYTHPDLVSDYIPVDSAIQAFVAAAWIRGTKKLEPSDDVEVYNCSTSHMKTMTMGEIIECGKQLIQEVPLEGGLWFPGGGLTTSRTVFFINVIFLHLLPAVLVDILLRLLGQKPMLVKLQRRIFSANLALQYYITQAWIFLNHNLLQLRSRIKEEDRAAFYYDLENFDQKEYFRNAIMGGKVYILQEKMEDLPKAKAHITRMKIVDRVVKVIFYGLVLWVVYRLDFTQNLINYFTYNFIL